MSDFSGIFQCGCCGETLPRMHMHTHHKIPRSVGGPDTRENLIDLCPGCHDALHNAAYKMLKKGVSHGQVVDALTIIYKENRKALDLCLKLATNVRDAMIKSAEAGIDPDQLVNVTTTLRKRYKDLLALKCKEMRISQDDYVRYVILHDLARSFAAERIDIAKEASYVRSMKRKPRP
jgi:hypothetical protein